MPGDDMRRALLNADTATVDLVPSKDRPNSCNVVQSAASEAVEAALTDLRSLGHSSIVAVFKSIADGVSRIAAENVIGGRRAHQATDQSNAFGDVQLEGDLLAEKLLVQELSKCEHVCMYSSEETPRDVRLNESGEYGVAFDPLDGSSIIGSNFSVGSIFGIFRGRRGFIGLSGGDMVGAAYAVYGPRTVLVVAYDTGAATGRVVKEFVLVGDSWALDATRRVAWDKKLMAPANLRASGSNKAYRSLVAQWMAEGYTLRYTGGMVPDIHNLLVKGGGVFCNPVSLEAPAKLRLLYECLPFAYIMESAEGRALTTDGVRVMEMVIGKHNDRIPICLGSPAQVAMSMDAFRA